MKWKKGKEEGRGKYGPVRLAFLEESEGDGDPSDSEPRDEGDTEEYGSGADSAKRGVLTPNNALRQNRSEYADWGNQFSVISRRRF